MRPRVLLNRRLFDDEVGGNVCWDDDELFGSAVKKRECIFSTLEGRISGEGRARGKGPNKADDDSFVDCFFKVVL
jgi:hypothetical protein